MDGSVILHDDDGVPYTLEDLQEVFRNAIEIDTPCISSNTSQQETSQPSSVKIEDVDEGVLPKLPPAELIFDEPLPEDDNAAVGAPLLRIGLTGAFGIFVPGNTLFEPPTRRTCRTAVLAGRRNIPNAPQPNEVRRQRRAADRSLRGLQAPAPRSPSPLRRVQFPESAERTTLEIPSFERGRGPSPPLSDDESSSGSENECWDQDALLTPHSDYISLPLYTFDPWRLQSPEQYVDEWQIS